MKIRIKGDSIRFRLTKSEVQTLCSVGSIEESTHLKSNTFTYAVEKVSTPGLQASLLDHRITLQVSENLLNGWPENDQVGFEATEPIDSQRRLHLLLEKDFVCLDQRWEDQSDNYPNPKLEAENNQD